MHTRLTRTAVAFLLLAGTGVAVSACDTYAGTREAGITCPTLGGPNAISSYQRRTAMACRSEQENLARANAHQQDVARGTGHQQDIARGN